MAKAVARRMEAMDAQAFGAVSSGLRRSRSPQQALQAVRQGLRGSRMGSVIDGDLSAFCDHVPHDTL